MAILVFLPTNAFAEDDVRAHAAPELVLEEEDFTYEKYQASLKWLDDVLEQYYKGKEPGWEIENLGIPNSLLRLQGYGLFAKRDIIRLKLENAKLKGAKKEVIAGLRKDLENIEKQIDIFLKENIWYD